MGLMDALKPDPEEQKRIEKEREWRENSYKVDVMCVNCGFDEFDEGVRFRLGTPVSVEELNKIQCPDCECKGYVRTKMMVALASGNGAAGPGSDIAGMAAAGAVAAGVAGTDGGACGGAGGDGGGAC